MQRGYILLQAQPVATGYHLKTIATWSQVIVFLILLVVAYFFFKKLLK